MGEAKASRSDLIQKARFDGGFDRVECVDLVDTGGVGDNGKFTLHACDRGQMQHRTAWPGQSGDPPGDHLAHSFGAARLTERRGQGPPVIGPHDGADIDEVTPQFLSRNAFPSVAANRCDRSGSLAGSMA